VAFDEWSRRDFLAVPASGTLAGAALGRGAFGTEAAVRPGTTHPQELDVRAFGPKGDGRTLDTKAINQAIAAAAIGQRLRTFFTPL
jgi:hypothetical protein